MVKLGEAAAIIMGQSPEDVSYNTDNVGVPLINGPVEFGPAAFSETLVTKYTTKPTKMCKRGDIILCVRGSTTGRMNIASCDVCIGRGVAAIRSQFNSYVAHVMNGLRDRIYHSKTTPYSCQFQSGQRYEQSIKKGSYAMHKF
jgi:type I restriction enzyme, S subunit